MVRRFQGRGSHTQSRTHTTAFYLWHYKTLVSSISQAEETLFEYPPQASTSQQFREARDFKRSNFVESKTENTIYRRARSLSPHKAVLSGLTVSRNTPSPVALRSILSKRTKSQDVYQPYNYLTGAHSGAKWGVPRP